LEGRRCGRSWIVLVLEGKTASGHYKWHPRRQRIRTTLAGDAARNLQNVGDSHSCAFADALTVFASAVRLRWRREIGSAAGRGLRLTSR
jgi:hypothetical protein